MRLNKFEIIAFIALIGLTITSCERKYDAPLLTEPEVTIGDEGVITIAKYKEMFASLPKEGKLIEENFALRAVVVGNDISGNIYKQIYVEDATGGLSISIDQNNIASDYPIGQEVVVKLQGLAATSYGGVTQLGIQGTNNNRIPYEIAKEHILKHKWPDAKKAQPTVTTIDALTDAMIGKLIQLEGVYFVDGGKLPFAETQQTVNRDLKDKSGNTLIVRNSGYANFANDKLPKGNGTVVGILSKFNSDYQLFLRSADDCFGFTGKEPETSGGAPTPTPDKPATGGVIYSETFTTDMGKMTAQNVSGAQSWRVNAQYKNVNMTGFADNKSNANEDWLISPAFDLTSATSFTITFSHTINKGDVSKMKSEQTLWVTDNYTGDVSTTKWTQLTIPTYPSGSDWKYVESGNINLPAELLGKANVVFAFKYLCTDASSGNWQIRDLKVTSEGGKLAEGGSTPTPTPNPVTPTPAPATGTLLFAGADFEDWKAFTAGLNKYKLIDYATQADGGRSGKALLIKGTPTKNDYVFTATAQSGTPTSGKTITFYIKGTSGKSISMNLTTADGTTYAYNLDSMGEKGHVVGPNDSNILLQPNEPKVNAEGTKSVANSYAQGSIDTKGEWVKITLNIEGKTLASTGDLFALKVGGKVNVNLLIDDITIQ